MCNDSTTEKRVGRYIINFTRALHSVLQKLGLMRRLESHMRALQSISLDLVHRVEQQLVAKYKEHVESERRCMLGHVQAKP